MSYSGRDLRGSIKEEQSTYRTILYGGGILAFMALVVVIVLRTIYADPNNHLISEAADAILFELVLILAGTIFGSAVVGVTFDQYQRRFGNKQETVNAFVINEGVVDVFRSATDPRLIQYLLTIIPNARSEIICSGLGLGILSHNHEILRAIGDRLNSIQGLRVGIYIGSGANAGVVSRTAEEKEWHDNNGIHYDATWVTRYPIEIQSVLKNATNTRAQERLNFVSVNDCPMLTVLKVDDIFLFFAYGTPNVRGSQSPWIAVDARASQSSLVSFLTSITTYYEVSYPNPNI